MPDLAQLGFGSLDPMWTDDRAAGQLPGAHLLVGLGGVVEGEALHVGADAALPGQLQALLQLDGASPVGDRQLRLERQGSESEVESAARETDDRRYFDTFAGQGYAFGINVLLYAMSH